MVQERTERSRTLSALLLALVGGALIAAGCAPQDSSSVDAPAPVSVAFSDALSQRERGTPELQIVSPISGATVRSPFSVDVIVDRFMLAPKGIVRDGEGHLHLLVDAPCVEPGEVISDDHEQLGDGRSQFRVELEPGVHDLCVQLGDGFHTALDVTHEITVTVTE